jgi:biotin-dependent carboxylase-like uncharacterized protein
MSMTVLQPGVLSLLQDNGRFGQHRLGLTNGGPVDREAFHYCNRILQNPPGSTCIEISGGGLQLVSEVDTWLCLAGASMPLSINDEVRNSWEALPVQEGDMVRIGFARSGCRAYLGVADGFQVAPCFGSTATVVREQIGGLHGTALAAGDRLPCTATVARKRHFLAERERPRYQQRLTVRVIPGYQQHYFSRAAQRQFFGSAYRVSERCDRMGYRLEGAPINCEIDSLLSEGICLGAIQLPPDGQPIVLLNDHQTIGGYPKMGTALSLDVSRLSQLVPGSTVHFAAITPCTARRALRLAHDVVWQRPLQERRA